MIENHPDLFTIDSKGKTRVWYIEQDGDKYRTVSGEYEGNLVTTEWTIVKGKSIGKANETSPEEQAKKDIESKYKKQLKTGYCKSIEELKSSKYVEPMSAKLYVDYAREIDFNKEQWAVQCKFNGIRCVATKDGLKSRKGELLVSVPHINGALVDFFEEHPNAILDGELFNEELRQNLNDINSIARRTKNISKEDLQKSKELIKYYIYDGYDFNNLTKLHPYHQRKSFIDSEVIPINKNYLVHVETVMIKSTDHLNEIYSEYVKNGHEGVMLRLMNTPYKHSRVKSLLKLKPKDDDEFKILDINEGTGNWAGKAKIITVEMPSGKVFNAVFKGSMVEATKCLQDKKEWIGKTVTIQYNGLTGLGTPNFAQFDYNNCLKGEK